MGHFFSYIVEPGFLSNQPVRTALLVGTVVAITSGVVGVLTVIRGQSFAGHSLADVATTGGAGAFLIGVSQFWGFLIAGMAAAALMELIGVQRRRGRDVATGVVLGAALGLAALFLYLGTQTSSTTGASFTILFGSMFVISPDTVPVLIASGVIALVVIAVLSRVLLLTSLSPEIAAARGVPVRAVGAAYLAALAVAVTLSAVVIGAVLSTALLIGPAATSLRLTRSPGRAMAASAAIGTVVTWIGILLAYDSYDWRPYHRSWPVSFFIVALVLIAYLLSYARRTRRRPQAREETASTREETPACSPALCSTPGSRPASWP
jgi:zinc/manganese transport system permease protein